MAENMIKFLRGNVASLPATATAGAVYFTKDEGLYLGLENGTYHRYGDFITVADVDSLPATGAHETCMYYCVAENVLAKWNDSEGKWIQINKQKTLAELGGVAKSVYDAKMAALEKADTDNATAISELKTYVGTIPEDATSTDIVGYVKERTTGIATDSALQDVQTSVALLDSRITGIADSLAPNGPVTLQINAIDEKAQAAQATADSKTTMAEVEAKNYATKTEAQGYANAKDEAIATAQAAAEAAAELAGTKATMDEVNTAIANAGHAVKADVDQAFADMDAAYKKADGDMKADLEVKINAKVAQADYDAKVAELAGADTTLQGNIDALAEKVGTPVDGKTVAEMAAAAQTAADTEKARAEGVEAELAAAIKAVSDDYLKAADKKELQDQITANASAIELLTNGVSADKVDGVNDLIKYVEEHGPEVTGMKEDIAENAEAIAGVAGRMTTAEGKITAVEGAVATKAEQTALDEAIEALEGADTSLGNRITALENQFTGDDSVDAKIATAKQEAIDAAAEDAANKDAVVLAECQQGIGAVQTAVDTVADRVTTAEGKITALETASATHALKTEVQAVQTALDEYETANNAAVALKADASAVSAMDEAYKAADTALSGRIKDLEDNKAGYATTGEVATAKSEAISEAATTAQGKVDALANGQVKANTEAIAANAAAITSGDEATLTSAKAYCETLMTWGSF